MSGFKVQNSDPLQGYFLPTGRIDVKKEASVPVFESQLTTPKSEDLYEGLGVNISATVKNDAAQIPQKTVIVPEEHIDVKKEAPSAEELGLYDYLEVSPLGKKFANTTQKTADGNFNTYNDEGQVVLVSDQKGNVLRKLGRAYMGDQGPSMYVAEYDNNCNKTFEAEYYLGSSDYTNWLLGVDPETKAYSLKRYEYNDEGLATSQIVQYYDSRGNSEATQVLLSYDGNEIKRMSCYVNGELQLFKDFELDHNGTVLKCTEYNPDGTVRDILTPNQ